LYELAPLAYQSLDAAGTILDVNVAWLDLFQRSRKDVIGRFIGDFLTESSQTALSNRFARFMKENHTEGNVFEIVRKDGGKRLVTVNGRIARDAAGEFLRTHCILTDVTERIEQKRQLRLAASVFSHAREAITITDAEGNIVIISQRFTEITGYSAEEVIGRNPRILQSGRQDAAFYKRMWAQITATGHWSGEIWNKRKNGSIYPEWLSISSVTDDAGKVSNYIAVFTDLSERVEAEQRLRESEQRYRTMFEQAPEGVWIIGADARTIKVNQHMCQLLGYSAAEMNGQTPFDFVDAENSLIFETQKQLRTKTTNRNYEIALRHKDGHNIPVAFSATNLYSEDGSLMAVLAFVTDISERKEHERKMQRFNDELEHRVVERTRALDIANHELEAFSYSVSHDLRTPLRAINGFSHALEEEYSHLLDDNGRNYLSRVRAGSERMAELIQKLLDLAHLSRHELRRVPIDLSAIAVEIAAELRIDEAERRVELNIAPGVTTIGDAALFRVVLLNLLGNAWKYTSRRDMASIEFGMGERDGRRVCFVRDNGAGFDMKNADKLFAAFQRLHSAADYPGSGIGLATVARIIHRHGGEVWAEAKPGEGATFFFTLA
jgi:PAS domain S-box-containing protein